MKKLSIILILSVAVLSWSCNKYVEGYEKSPNAPTTVTPALLLTGIQVSTFNSYTTNLVRTPMILTQHLAGVNGQMYDYAQYNIEEGTFVNEFENIYWTLLNAQELEHLAGASNPYYQGIAKVISALNYGLATNLWGDIPIRQEWNGIGTEVDEKPSYSSQEKVYEHIQKLLDDAIVLFNKPDSVNILFPGLDDYIYNGDMTKWKKAANMLKARYHNHLSQVNANSSAQNALNAITNANLTGPEDDMLAMFGENGNELNQWYAFQNDRGGYLKMGKTFIDMLKSSNDPRLPFFAATDTGGDYSGTPLGSTEDWTSDPGSYLVGATTPVALVSYVEMKFIEAEANFRLGNKGPAATAYNDAVKASILQVTGSSDPVYEAANANETALTITLEKIMTQKYLAMFGQNEAYVDWRRTDIPSLSPNPDAGTGKIPLRFPTSQNERIYNPNAIVVSDLFMPVWWDK